MNQENNQINKSKKIQFSTQFVILATAIIITTGLILGSWILSNRTTVIRSLGSETTQDGQIANTISVSGEGKVSAKPDLVRISVSFEETKTTSQQALEAVNQKINELKEVLSKQGVASQDITTTDFRLFPEYNFTQQGRDLLGQQASQSVSFSIKNVDEQGQKAAVIIDEISKIDNVRFNSVNFDIENKENIYSQARKLAMEQAKVRAKEIAEASEVEIGSVINIKDFQQQESLPRPFESNIQENNVRTEGGNATAINTGELEISLNINVIYEINPK
jgi:uncharacterized protein YggE